MKKKEFTSRIPEYTDTSGEMTPVIMRSIITLMDRDEVSIRMFNFMVEYAMG